MAITAAAFRADKRCGKSGIPENAKCTKRTSAKSQSGPELKERAFAAATAVQGVRAARSALTGNKGRAVKQLLSAGKNASEYAQERGERTGNKKLLAFATGKNVVESAQAARSAKRALQTGNLKGAGLAASEALNTAVESYSFNRQRQGKTLSNFEEQNRNFGDLLQAQKWLAGARKATARKPTMRINPRTFSRSLRRQNKLNNARLMTEKMRRKYEPGYRNSKKPFWADGFEGELTAGLFRGDKKCGQSGIPDTAKCTKGVGRTVAQQKKRESVPKDKEYKQLRSLEKEMDKNAPPKRNIVQKIGRKISGAEKREKNEKTIAALKKKYGANSPEANGGESLNPKGATYKWIKKNRPDLDPDKIGANSPLAMEIAKKYVKLDSMTAADFRDDACWKGYIQKGVKRKGNRTVPNCVSTAKATAEVKRKTGQDGEDKLTRAKRTVWAEGFEPKKMKARR